MMGKRRAGRVICRFMKKAVRNSPNNLEIIFAMMELMVLELDREQKRSKVIDALYVHTEPDI